MLSALMTIGLFLTIMIVVSLFQTATIYMVPLVGWIRDTDASPLWYILTIPCWGFGMFLFTVYPTIYLILTPILMFVCWTAYTEETIGAVIIAFVFGGLMALV